MIFNERIESNVRKHIKRAYNSKIYKKGDTLGLKDLYGLGIYQLNIEDIEKIAINICEYIENAYDLYTEYEIGGEYLIKITME